MNRSQNQTCKIPVIFLALATWALAAASLCAQEQPRLVGDWGDPDRLIIDGNKTFSVDQIRSALLQNFDFLEDGHPLAKLEDFRHTLMLKTDSGYLNAGFPHVKVDTHLDEAAQHLVVSINEGPRYRCGEVLVTGTFTFSPALLVNWLTSPQPPADAVLTGFSGAGDKETPRWADTSGLAVDLESPTWQRGKPVPFDEQGTKALREKVRRALAVLGCPWAVVDVATPLDETTGTANLQIKIKQQGHFPTVGHISIVGNQRDSEQDVINYLDFKQGTILTESERTRLWYKLWMSGRYLKQDVDLIAPPNAAGLAELRITLVEYDQAPPLAKPLTPVQQALMKCRQWVLDSKDRGDDWVCKFHGPLNGCAVLSPKSGLLIHIEPRLSDAKAFRELLGDLSWPEMVFAVTPEHLLYASSTAPKKLMLPYEHLQLTSNIIIIPYVDPANPSRHFNLQLGGGLSSDAPKDSSPVDFRIAIAPAWLFEELVDNSKCEFNDGNVEITNVYDSEKRFRSIEMSSGRLISLKWEDQDHLTGFEILIEPGAFDRELALADKRLNNRILNNENAFDSHRPFTSAAEYLLDESLVNQGLSALSPDKKSEKPNQLRHALHNMIAAGLFKQLDEYIVASPSDQTTDVGDHSNEDFSIPDECNQHDELTQLYEAIERLILTGSNATFPRSSSPWSMVRDLTLWLSGRDKCFNVDYKNLGERKDFGPLNHLLFATFFRCFLNSYYYENVRAHAEQGLKMSEQEHFSAELVPLLDRRKLCGKCVYHVAEVLQQLDEDDATAIGSLFLGSHCNLLGNVSRRLRQSKDMPIETVLPAVLDQMWTDGLKSIVEARLQQLSKCGEEKAENPSEDPALKVNSTQSR